MGEPPVESVMGPEASSSVRHLPQMEVLVNPRDGQNLFDTERKVFPQFYNEIMDNPWAYTVGGISKDCAQIINTQSEAEEPEYEEMQRFLQIHNSMGYLDFLIEQQQAAAEREGRNYTLTEDDVRGLKDFIEAGTRRLPQLQGWFSYGRYTEALDLDNQLKYFLDGVSYSKNGKHRALIENSPGGKEVTTAMEDMRTAIAYQVGKYSAVKTADELVALNAASSHNAASTADAADAFVRSLPTKPE